MTGAAKRHGSYVSEQVRRYDNDRFLCALFAPADKRQALLALLAFNVEVAKIREVVSEPMLGEIRLQWWRETIADIYAGSPRRHEVAIALSTAVHAYGLSRERFDELIDAREADLWDEPPATMNALRDYARATSANLTWLALEVLGVRDEETLEAGLHIGTAWALLGQLRAAPYLARAGRLPLPQDRLLAVGARPGEFFEFRGSPALAAVSREIAQEVKGELTAARALRRDVVKRALPALLPAVIVNHWLRRMEEARYDIFDRSLARPTGPGVKLRLALAARLGRY